MQQSQKREAASFGTVPGGSLLWIHFKWFSGFSEDLELSVHKSRANRINCQKKKYVVQQVTRIHMSKAVAERSRGLFRYSLKLTPTMTKGVAQPADTSENNAKSR